MRRYYSKKKKKLNKYTGSNLILIRYENDFENTIKIKKIAKRKNAQRMYFFKLIDLLKQNKKK